MSGMSEGYIGGVHHPDDDLPNARLPRARVTADKRPPTDRPASPLACLSGLWQRPPWPLSRPELEPAAQEAPTVQGRAHGQ